VLIQVIGARQAVSYSSWQVAGPFGDFIFEEVPTGKYSLRVASPYATTFLTLLHQGDVAGAASHCLDLRYVPLRAPPIGLQAQLRAK
jgi:hypothetical protein